MMPYSTAVAPVSSRLVRDLMMVFASAKNEASILVLLKYEMGGWPVASSAKKVAVEILENSKFEPILSEPYPWSLFLRSILRFSCVSVRICGVDDPCK
ncbi:hypothetical protein GCM10027404_02100 [Arthrobacter tumbae]